MAIFVPALRLVMLFLNVYDSYKTLKPPQPSVRDPTRPSVRAMTQRKRDMKGCLAVWVVFVRLQTPFLEGLELNASIVLLYIVRTNCGKPRQHIHPFLRRVQVDVHAVPHFYTSQGT